MILLKLCKVINTLQNKAGHLTAQEPDTRSLIPIFFRIYSRLRDTRKYTEGPQQAGEMDSQASHNMQQQEMPGAVLGEE